MEKLTGTLHQSDLEGGVWVFQARNGRQYHLDGLPTHLQKEGAHLEVEGEESNAMSFGMMGSVFRVHSARQVH